MDDDLQLTVVMVIVEGAAVSDCGYGFKPCHWKLSILVKSVHFKHLKMLPQPPQPVTPNQPTRALRPMVISMIILGSRPNEYRPSN